MYVHGIRKLFSFKMYVVEHIRCDEDMAVVRLRLDRRFNICCPDCGAKMSTNKISWQDARDISLGIAQEVMLVYEAPQGKCYRCNSYVTVHPECVDPYAKATRRLMEYASLLCRFMPVQRVAQILPISSSTALRWDKQVLERTLPDPNFDGIKVLMVDEKSIWKNHSYVTVVINGETGELLHMAEGKKKKAFSSFFDKLTPEQKSSIEAVAMDRGGTYRAVVKQEIPDAEIVYDKFHIIKNYLSDVVDAVRRRAYRGAVGRIRNMIKGKRYTLFKNPEKLRDDEKMELQELLDAYEDISCVYVLKEELRALWRYKYGAWAKKHFQRWISWAREAENIPGLHRFADSLEKSKEEILNFFKHRITLGRLEGFNNLIARMVHRACGYDDMRYLFLKLRQDSLCLHPQS